MPYTLKFVHKAPDSENPEWKSALEHHYKNNPHHPQVRIRMSSEFMTLKKRDNFGVICITVCNELFSHTFLIIGQKGLIILKFVVLGR